VRVDVVELWVRDLGAIARTLATWFGFEPDDAGLAPRPYEEVAVLRSGDVSFVLRRGTSAESRARVHRPGGYPMRAIDHVTYCHRAGAIGFGPNNVRALFAAVDAAMRTDRRETP
jgi:4-hydroxyphenylpyruvate dioxygenase-like putative hemolysin